MTAINPNTKSFLEKMYDLLEDYEKKALNDEKNFLELLIAEYGHLELKYDKDTSLIMASLAMQRGLMKIPSGVVIWYTIQEYLEQFSFLFKTKEVEIDDLKIEYLIRIESFLERNKSN